LYSKGFKTEENMQSLEELGGTLISGILILLYAIPRCPSKYKFKLPKGPTRRKVRSNVWTKEKPALGKILYNEVNSRQEVIDDVLNVVLDLASNAMEETPSSITVGEDNTKDDAEDVAEDVVMDDAESSQAFSPAKTMEEVLSNIIGEMEDIVMADAQSHDTGDEDFYLSDGIFTSIEDRIQILQKAADKPDEIEDIENNTGIKFQVVGGFTVVSMVEKMKKGSLSRNGAGLGRLVHILGRLSLKGTATQMSFLAGEKDRCGWNSKKRYYAVKVNQFLLKVPTFYDTSRIHILHPLP
jgi:hypothetical protein